MTPRSKPLILVVDDDETIRKVLRTALERDGFDVLVAENGVRALDAIRKSTRRIELLLADVVMPEMGGVELAETVHAMPDPPPVILMSGIIHDPAKVRIGDFSPPFVQKPFNISGLLKLIHRHVGSSR